MFVLKSKSLWVLVVCVILAIVNMVYTLPPWLRYTGAAFLVLYMVNNWIYIAKKSRALNQAKKAMEADPTNSALYEEYCDAVNDFYE